VPEIFIPDVYGTKNRHRKPVPENGVDLWRRFLGRVMSISNKWLLTPKTILPKANFLLTTQTDDCGDQMQLPACLPHSYNNTALTVSANSVLLQPEIGADRNASTVSVAKCVVCAWNSPRSVGGQAEPMSWAFLNPVYVISQVRRCLAGQRRVNETCQLEVNTFLDRKPVQLMQNWRDKKCLWSYDLTALCKFIIIIIIIIDNEAINRLQH